MSLISVDRLHAEARSHRILVKMGGATLLSTREAFAAVDAFSGCGGLSLGLRDAGFDVRLAFDIDPFSVATHNKALSDRCIEADVLRLSGQDILRRAGIHGELDLLAGGPPCQGFSKQKRGAHLGDRRNALVLEFLRLVDETKPRAFILENVPMMAQVRGRRLVERFHSLGNYDLTGEFYIAADYGVAQTRQRFVMVGIRADQAGSFKIPDPITPRWLTVGDVIRDLPEPPRDYSEHPDFPNHKAAHVTEANIRRFSFVPQGGGWQDIPFEFRLPCHQVADTSCGGWPDVYGRLSWNGQCPTITGGFDSFTRGRYGHPAQDRPLTSREAARLQGFPDRFIFAGTRYDVRHQIGNAVPVPLARTLGESIDRALRGETRWSTGQPVPLFR